MRNKLRMGYVAERESSGRGLAELLSFYLMFVLLLLFTS